MYQLGRIYEDLQIRKLASASWASHPFKLSRRKGRCSLGGQRGCKADSAAQRLVESQELLPFFTAVAVDAISWSDLVQFDPICLMTLMVFLCFTPHLQQPKSCGRSHCKKWAASWSRRVGFTDGEVMGGCMLDICCAPFGWNIGCGRTYHI